MHKKTIDTKIKFLKIERLKDSKQRLKKINSLPRGQGVEVSELLFEEARKEDEYLSHVRNLKRLLLRK